MNLKELTEYLVKSIVLDIDDVLVENIKNDDNQIIIVAKVSDTDMGRVIGKDGKVINAIRTILQEASSLRDNQYVKLEIEKH